MLTQGIQLWTVPQTGVYRFTLTGGSGGIHSGSFYPCFSWGAGAVVQGDITLTSGDVIKIVVGQKPSSTTGQIGNGAGGGGGSWVYTGPIGASGNLLFVARRWWWYGPRIAAFPQVEMAKVAIWQIIVMSLALVLSFGVNPRSGSGSAGNNV